MKSLMTAAAFAFAAALSTPTVAAEHTAIIERITDIAAGADRHDWSRVRSAFADEVMLDYTSLWGGNPTTQAADEVIGQWSTFLPGFESTHHMVTNHTVTSRDGDAATAEADFTATHRIGEALWVLGGRYGYDMIRVEGDWKVSGLTMTALWETGERNLVSQAAQRASQKN